jgi:hypothetical protein
MWSPYPDELCIRNQARGPYPDEVTRQKGAHDFATYTYSRCCDDSAVVYHHPPTRPCQTQCKVRVTSMAAHTSSDHKGTFY